jgi:hypothetical protein
MRLRVTNSAGQGSLIMLDGDSAVIGRDPDCDVVLDNIFVSRFHARLRADNGEYELTDLDSRNGIEIDGQPVAGRAVLTGGSAFTIGPFELRIVERSRIDEVTQQFVVPDRNATPTLIVDESTHEVFIGAVPIRPRLSRLEFRLLALLHDAGGSICHRTELGDMIWGSDQWDLNMLHRLVHRLKEKIEPIPDQPRYVVTVPGVGYRLQSG